MIMKCSFSELVLMHEISGKPYLEVADAKFASETNHSIGNGNSELFSSWRLNPQQKDAIEEWFTGLQDNCRNADLVIKAFYSRYLPLIVIILEFQKGSNVVKAEFQPSNFIFSANEEKHFEFLPREWKLKRDAMIEIASSVMN